MVQVQDCNNCEYLDDLCLPNLLGSCEKWELKQIKSVTTVVSALEQESEDFEPVKHKIWFLCGNCHTPNEIEIPVFGVGLVAQKCSGDDCDCSLSISIIDDPGGLTKTIKFTMVTGLA
jgi:hypothetical protein